MSDIKIYLDKKSSLVYDESEQIPKNIEEILSVNQWYIEKYSDAVEKFSMNAVTNKILSGTNAPKLYKKLSVTATRMLQYATDPYIDFIERKKFWDHWMLIPYNQEVVDALTSGKLGEIYSWLVEQKNSLGNWAPTSKL